MSDTANNTDNVPAWVEAILFEKVLRENVANFKEIKEFKAYAGLAPGENYSTIMTRIEILIELEGDKLLSC